MKSNAFLPISLAVLTCLGPAGCGYHRLDTRPRKAAWMAKGDTVRIVSFVNLTSNLGVEERFRKALENRLVAASPWKLTGPNAASRWVIQGTLEKYSVSSLGVNQGSTTAKAAAGSATRLEVTIAGSLRLLDGQTGTVMVSTPSVTFSKQYRVDQNYASYDNHELEILDSLADDFSETCLTQLLEGHD